MRRKSGSSGNGVSLLVPPHATNAALTASATPTLDPRRVTPGQYHDRTRATKARERHGTEAEVELGCPAMVRTRYLRGALGLVLVAVTATAPACSGDEE